MRAEYFAMIAVIGDTHQPRGSRRLPARCLELLREAELILHTGDVTARIVLEELSEFAPVLAVHGNVDEPELRESLPERRTVCHAGLRIGLVHDPGPRDGRIERLTAWFPDCDVIAFGHTHWAELERHGRRWILNPGSPTERRRSPHHTMVVLESGVPRLVTL